MAHALLGPASPYKGLWFERKYPPKVAPSAVLEAARSPAGVFLAERFSALLTRKPGQVRPPPSMHAAALWALALVRRLGPPPPCLLSPDLFINLLTENDGTSCTLDTFSTTVRFDSCSLCASATRRSSVRLARAD